MDVHGKHSDEEVERLRRCMNDLLSMLALPAIWSGREPSQIVRTLFDVLPNMLLLDLLYVRLNNPNGETTAEWAQVTESPAPGASPHEVGETLNHCLGNDPQNWPALARQSFGGGDIAVVPMRLGLQGEIGVIVAGSRRADFPDQSERLLLNVAANQATMGLQEARLLGEQKRVARELIRRIAQRTDELAAINEELKREIDERRRTEEALRTSERNLRQTIDTLPALAWSARTDGSAEFFNQHYLDYVGLSHEQVQDWGWTAAVHPDDLSELTRAWQHMMDSDAPGECEGRLRRFDGEYRSFLFRANPLRDESGTTVKWYGTNTDIEDRKRAEERNRLIINTALDAVVTMDAQGTVASWNNQAEIVFGWSEREAIGRRMSDMIIPEQQRIAHERGLRRFLATGEGPMLRRRIEVAAVRRSGVEFSAELQVVPMRVGEGWVFSAFIRDITESKIAQEKLRDSELRLREMTETIPEMLWSASPDGMIDYVNTRFIKYTGFPAEEVMGTGWQKTIHPDDARRAAPVWMSCIATGAPYRVEVRTYNAAHRAYRWCAVSALPLLGQEGRILKWHGTIVDMHDWKQAQEDLRNTQANLAHVTRLTSMGVLTASIAHEINQPLAAIVTNAGACLRMLAADPPNMEGARETAKRTIRDGNRASDMVTRLRALFSKKDISTELVDLNEATREVMALTQNELLRSQVVLRPELADDLPAVMGDRVQLQQVIMNLFLNAAESMSSVVERSRALVVRTEPEEGNRVRLSVQDSGVGFSQQDAGKLFEAFYTTKKNGMGIGLSVSRAIIENHQGRLWAAPNDGPGATFLFSIPCGSDDRMGAGKRPNVNDVA